MVTICHNITIGTPVAIEIIGFEEKPDMKLL